jgi:hypothetical protein
MELVLSKLKGGVKVCDPYIDNKTLDFHAECRTAADIGLLTANVYEGAKVRRDLAAFAKEHKTKIELRVAPAGLLHDRYIIHDSGMLGEDIRAATLRAFDAVWAKASAF